MNKEQKFYNILQDLFVGAKLEGDSGYVNLMNIKTDYFNLIKKKIEEEIKKRFGDEKPQDLYDKLYTFFNSYFSDGGAIFFSSTPSYKNIYAKVYSDREDVSLFWKTSKLYYVKSEADYRTIENLQLNSDTEVAFDFHFDASFLKHKQSNEKKELQFFFIGVGKRAGKRIIKFRVVYKNDNKYDKLKEILNIKDNAKIIKYVLGNLEKLDKKIIFKNNGLDLKIVQGRGGRDFVKAGLLIQDNKDLLGNVSVEPAILDTSDIEKYLRIKDIILNSEDIEKAFKVYKKQTEIDYFIHKDAKGFLREQFDLYMYQYLTGNLETIFEQKDLDRIKNIKEIAYLSIDYIGNFENELKNIWLKPKFARKSNYVLTLDRLADKSGGIRVIEKIIKHNGIKSQISEWRGLGIIKDNFNQKDIMKSGKLNEDLQTLPIDTKYFKNLEIEIIGLFDNLDEALDGRLIKSDNFQALNTLLSKYKEQIQTIYIDPPFNLGQNANFDYLVNYKDSTWATILENRLDISRDWLNETGSIFVRCDYNGNWIVRCLLDYNLNQENFKNEIIVAKSNRIKTEGVKYPSWHDSLYLYAKDYSKNSFYHVSRERDERKWRQIDNRGEVWSVISEEVMLKISPQNIIYNKKGQPTSRARIILGQEFLPPDGRRFPSQEAIIELENKNAIKINDQGTPQMLNSESVYLTDNWTDVFGYDSKWDFVTENAEIIIKRSIETSSDKNSDIILDFFLGSGTTTAVAHKLNKKWIGIEMGDQFYDKALPRMKEVLAGLGNHEPCGVSKDINWQGGGFFKYYELEQYEDTLKKAIYNPIEKELENIDFCLSEKQAQVALSIDLKKEVARFIFEKLYQDVDVAETISNLFGKKIKRITKDKVVFEDELEVDLKNLDFGKYESLKNLIYW